MTLKEKFKQWLDTNPRLQIREVQLEVIADEFIIEFVDWYDLNNFKYNGWEKTTSTKQLLEIFKKEKGL